MRTNGRRRAIGLAAGLVLSVLAAACEYAFSDVATRIRYSLLQTLASRPEVGQTATLSLTPDHWPDACPGEGGYRVTITPYRGGKQVRSGDIRIACHGRRSYYTGLGSEDIDVAGDLTAEKRRDEALVITVRGTERGMEIVRLE